ncbi:hypothetical protein VUJ46_04485 [Chryseobacterium sp. MYb264]|uniref:hypothetical protein n=1 Tax=Chryseobacterium sp. MYb264 TaxID=2745153 RepID=UPI002E0EA498|nr:hypothetical protein VUJ46_04485 [Chryseobacterium sp. MYb264]
MKKHFVLSLSLLSLIYCKKEHKNESFLSSKVEKIGKDSLISHNSIKYFRFQPDTISNINIDGFETSDSFSYQGNKFITGYYRPIEGEIANPDTENDYGKRLLVMNDKNEIIFKGIGSGDTFQYQPKFYRNDSNNKVVIICQMAFEYFFGGEAFLLENNKIKHIGNLDIESDKMEKKLTDIIKIDELKNDIIFSFKSDSLLLSPGSDDILIPNHNVRYIYSHSKLSLKR